MQHMHQLTANY